MFNLRHKLGDAYSPLYFLSALGAGGAVVTFFMYLMFMTPHKGTPIPTWESLQAVLQGDNPMLQLLVAVSLLGIIVLSVLHVRLLVWNVNEYRYFRQSATFHKLRQSNSEVQLMAIPLTFAMTINVGFILGALFVPGLWNVVEYLFPLAILAFGITGWFAARIFIDFMSRVLVTGHFDCSRNNNLSQMLAIFAFGMIGVGFSAAAAMSEVPLTSGIGLVLSLLFISTASLLAVTKLILGFRAMLEHGIDRESSVSLWIIIPIITVSGIALYRLSMAMHHNFGLHVEPVESLGLLTVLLSVQILFAILGYAVMKKLGYFDAYVYGKEKSAGSFALICPGVAGYVMGFFFIHVGLVGTGLLEKNSLAYFFLLVPLVVLQIQTLWGLFHLNAKLLKQQPLLPLPITA
ncbi:TsoY family (seleno)protein [Thiothrix subterranea]|uniref:Uncharacterized protein n=1 Tax=Thiothrix subterranea TaxID=2735563 RepID=A0AA51MKX1_9GAMM|nr:hypothetical protein [Thiothrix subterranea]MDQ5769901.1 hypothetical protein [Thiothrix subterranea]WML86073.1 hypothetical protein RCG00_17465 [Thiothrix subterranea]